MSPVLLRPQKKPDKKHRSGWWRFWRQLLFLVLVATASQLPALGQVSEQQFDLQIDSSELATALDHLARITGLQLIYSEEDIRSATSNKVAGRYSVNEALLVMLGGTGLSGGLTKNGVIVISSTRPEERDMRKSRGNTLFGGLVALIIGTDGAIAQSAENKTDDIIEEIVVTAQKRSATLQSTPISITAISSDMIETAQIDDIRDIQQLAPSLTFNDAPAGLQLYMRGVGQDAPTVGNNPGVAVYVDGIYQGHQFANAAAFQDVERVEVLRGPQGTLYGRNSTGGNINVISNSPHFDREVKFGVTVGEFDHRRYNLTLNNGLVDDTLAVRASYSFSDRDGYRENEFSGDDIDFEEVTAGTVSLLYTPSAEVEFLFRADYQDVEGTGNPSSYLAAVPGSGLSPLVFGGQTTGEDSTDVNNDTVSEEDARYWGVSGTLNWEIGELQFRSITSYRESRRRTFLDSDGTSLAMVTIGQTSNAEEFSQEFNLLGSAADGKFDWIVGASYYRDDVSTDPLVLIPIFALLLPPLPPSDTLDGVSTTTPFVHNSFEEELTSIGAFAEGTFHHADRLRSTFGVRFTKDDKDVVTSSIGNITAPAAQCRDLKSSESWSTPTFKVGVDYDLSDRAMMFASASRGFKAGGFNSGSCSDPFDEEELNAYEIGVKSTLLDRRLTLNAAAFYYDYTDLQVRSFTENLALDIANAAESTIYGVELEFVVKPVPAFQIDGGINLQRSEYDKAMLDQPMVRGINPEDVSGNSLLRAPEAKANIGIQYSFELADRGSLQIRYDASYSDEFFVDAFENSFSTIDSHTIENLRVTWRNRSENVLIQAFIENLADEEYLEWRQSAAGIGGTSGLWAPPRRFGLRLNYSL